MTLGCGSSWLLWVGIIQCIDRPTVIRNDTSLVATSFYQTPVVIQRRSAGEITSHAYDGNRITAGCLLPDLTLQKLKLCRTKSGEAFFNWFGHEVFRWVK